MPAPGWDRRMRHVRNVPSGTAGVDSRRTGGSGVKRHHQKLTPLASGGQGVSRSCWPGRRSSAAARTPTPEIKTAWGEWFESVADKTADIGFHGGTREISHDGSRDLPMGIDSITGFSILNAKNLEEAEALARENPFIAGIRV